MKACPEPPVWSPSGPRKGAKRSVVTRSREASENPSSLGVWSVDLVPLPSVFSLTRKRPAVRAGQLHRKSLSILSFDR